MPMHYDDESPEPLLLKLPPLPDELVVTMYELVQLFLEQYEERYQHRIQRFYYERRLRAKGTASPNALRPSAALVPTRERQTVLVDRHPPPHGAGGAGAILTLHIPR